MISMYIILLLMHVLGDVVLQWFKMDKLKRFSIPWLLLHVGIYTAVAFVFSIAALELGLKASLVFVGVNAILHFIVDYFTGMAKRVTWEKKRENLFFGVVIIDQFSHLILLFLTFNYIIKHPF
jgi:hypothetical protein